MSLPRAYLRIDPNLDAHPDQDAMLTLILFGNRCSERGRFRSLSMIEKILGKKRLKACLDRKDLIPISGGRYYVSGWDEWQEGDLTVGERMGRVRRRRSMSEKDLEEDDRNGGVTNTVTEPSPERITGRNSSSEALTLTLDVDGTDINPGRSVKVSSHAAHKLALEAYGVDLGALAMAGATPAETGPAPKTPTLSVTVAPGRCPMCDGPITHTTEAGAKVLRCLDDQGLRCDWSAVWREVA